MSNQISTSTQFECYVNGSAKTLVFEDARERFRKSNIGYIVPLGFYRYRIGDFQDHFFLANRGIQSAEAEFAYELHRRRCAALTLDDMNSTHNDGRKFQRNTLNARASRFFRAAYSAMPKELRPYEVRAVPGRGHKTQPGYLLRSGISCCVIVDQVWTGTVRPYFDWSMFDVFPNDHGNRESA